MPLDSLIYAFRTQRSMFAQNKSLPVKLEGPLCLHY